MERCVGQTHRRGQYRARVTRLRQVRAARRSRPDRENNACGDRARIARGGPFAPGARAAAGNRGWATFDGNSRRGAPFI